ncbi:hypothetical protein BH24ACT19_BH24ACT19_13890 [soil metagenome]
MTPMSAIRRKADNRLEAKKDYTDYAVYESGGRSVGRVKERFVSADDGIEYLDIKTGFLGLRSLLVPTGAARVDRKRHILLLR